MKCWNRIILKLFVNNKFRIFLKQNLFLKIEQIKKKENDKYKCESIIKVHLNITIKFMLKWEINECKNKRNK